MISWGLSLCSYQDRLQILLVDRNFLVAVAYICCYLLIMKCSYLERSGMFQRIHNDSIRDWKDRPYIAIVNSGMRWGLLSDDMYPGWCLLLLYKTPANWLMHQHMEWNNTKIKMRKLLLRSMYVHSAWSNAVDLSTCRVVIFPMGTEYICDPVGIGVPVQGLLLPASFAFIFVMASWYLLMSSSVGTPSLIDHWDQCKYSFIVISWLHLI